LYQELESEVERKNASLGKLEKVALIFCLKEMMFKLQLQEKLAAVSSVSHLEEKLAKLEAEAQHWKKTAEENAVEDGKRMVELNGKVLFTDSIRNLRQWQRS
jgi:hypothetical protein